MTRTCLLCDGTDHEVAFREFEIDVLRCLSCGHIFSSYDADVHYEGYWGDEVNDPGEFYWDEAHGPMFDGFFQRYTSEKEGRLLDVGCGLGYFVRQAQRRLPAWECHGVEISPTATKFAREQLGLEHITTGLLEESGYPEGHFDVVTMWDVLEHLREPDALLEAVRGILKPGGLCFMHTPNAQVQLPKAKLKRALKGMRPDIHYLEAKDHLHLFTPTTATRLLKRCGYGPVDVVHLPPIQSVSGGRGALGRGVKNAWSLAARGLDAMTGGRVNLDNLFLAAYRPVE